MVTLEGGDRYHDRARAGGTRAGGTEGSSGGRGISNPWRLTVVVGGKEGRGCRAGGGGAVGDGCWAEVERMSWISLAEEHCGGRRALAVVWVRGRRWKETNR
jgi:hypothetical protein